MNQTNKDIKITAEFGLTCDFPTKKAHFMHLLNALKKKGYNVKEEIIEVDKDEFEIFIEYNGHKTKIFTNIDPKAKEAILDSNLELRISDVVAKIEQAIK
jgi:hypothetical protein